MNDDEIKRIFVSSFKLTKYLTLNNIKECSIVVCLKKPKWWIEKENNNRNIHYKRSVICNLTVHTSQNVLKITQTFLILNIFTTFRIIFKKIDNSSKSTFTKAENYYSKRLIPLNI